MFFAECQIQGGQPCSFLMLSVQFGGYNHPNGMREHINPIELRDFDKVVNLFIERFLFNTEALPTLNHLYNLKQENNEKARDFIRKWRSIYNKMRTPII